MPTRKEATGKLQDGWREAEVPAQNESICSECELAGGKGGRETTTTVGDPGVERNSELSRGRMEVSLTDMKTD